MDRIQTRIVTRSIFVERHSSNKCQCHLSNLKFKADLDLDKIKEFHLNLFQGELNG